MSQDDTKDRTIVASPKTEASEPNPQEPFLIQIAGKETGQMYSLKAPEIAIGRDPKSDIAVDDLHVSRKHGRITHLPGGELKIEDLGSTNGVFVNGQQVKEQILHEGDKVRIGTRLYFRFTYQDAVDQSYQQKLFQAANIDTVTGLYNRKYFIDILSKEFSYAKRSKAPLSLLMIDIDHFKQVNDTYGHLAGDAVLGHIGKLLKKDLRHENTACRYGGEEFCIVLRNSNGANAHQIGERMRTNIQKQEVRYQEIPIHVTISVGIASTVEPEIETIEDLIEQADQCLYEAKERGRNRTIGKKAA